MFEMQKRYFPLCQNTHIKNESPNYIIDYDQKNILPIAKRVR